MEHGAMAVAKAKNASEDTGWASNFVEAVVQAKDAMNASKAAGMMSRSEEIELHADGPRPVVKPPPPVPPKKPPPPFFESPYRSEDEELTGLRVMSPGEPIPHGKM
eukprot:1741901-Amphidinium_carterae.1